MRLRFEWFLCWCAYWTVLSMPDPIPYGRFTLFILPYAGMYGYTEGGFAEFKENRASFCSFQPLQ